MCPRNRTLFDVGLGSSVAGEGARSRAQRRAQVVEASNAVTLAYTMSSTD